MRPRKSTESEGPIDGVFVHTNIYISIVGVCDETLTFREVYLEIFRDIEKYAIRKF